MIKRLLRTKLAWRLTGISYRSAVIATRGSYCPKGDYLKDCANHMSELKQLVHGMNVLEFGCGIGGNLISLSDCIKRGVGIDVNNGYLRLARKLASETGVTNVEFIHFDGTRIPNINDIEAIYSMMVFERIPKVKVWGYVRQMQEIVGKNGLLILYFLAERAKNTNFAKRLGTDAYIYWNKQELLEGFREHELNIISTMDLFKDIAEVYVLTNQM